MIANAFYIGVTDSKWFKFLSSENAQEVNFWQPGGNQPFKALSGGEPFLFKLKHPINAVVGGGFFLRHTFLPVDIAWKVFETKNGASDFYTFANQIYDYRAKNKHYERNPTIGCITLTNCFYFAEELWLPQPDSWHPSIVVGKTYHPNTDQDARAYWSKIVERINWGAIMPAEDQKDVIRVGEEKPAYGVREMRYRLGQSGFRLEVLEAYHRRCAITGEKTLPALEAAHIKPYAQNGPHLVENGVFLRADIHNLFDAGYLTITRDYRVEVSQLIKEQFENGREYYAYHGKPLAILPENFLLRPSETYVEWHNEKVFAD